MLRKLLLGAHCAEGSFPEVSLLWESNEETLQNKWFHWTTTNYHPGSYWKEPSELIGYDPRTFTFSQKGIIDVAKDSRIRVLNERNLI